MNMELSEREFRLLLDMVYIGNWVLNSTREERDRITEYDKVESRVFSRCHSVGMGEIANVLDGEFFPSRKFEDGGIHEAIATYEDAVFFDILAEELARRDMEREALDPENVRELNNRIDAYIDEFEQNGMDHLVLDK